MRTTEKSFRSDPVVHSMSVDPGRPRNLHCPGLKLLGSEWFRLGRPVDGPTRRMRVPPARPDARRIWWTTSKEGWNLDYRGPVRWPQVAFSHPAENIH